MNLLGISFSASAWLAPMTALAAMAGAAAVILLRDHLRLERHTHALEADVARLTGEMQLLAKAGARDHAILAAQRDLVVLRDRDGTITYANEPFARFLQRRCVALVGSKNMPRPKASNPPQTLADGATLIEEAYDTPEGERWIAWIETRLEGSSRPGLLRVGRPIANPTIEAPSGADAGLSRSLRAPLGGIVGLSTLLLDTALDGEQAIHARRIKALAEDLVRRVEHPPAAEQKLAVRAAPGGARVLLAEDNEINGLFAVQSLEMAGALVDWARDGDEAISSVEASFAGTSPPYDLVLMDIRMPRVNGLEATRRIRALEAQQGRHDPLRIVALTATTMPQDRLAAEEAGIDGFLAKPYRADALVRLLSQRTESLARAS